MTIIERKERNHNNRKPEKLNYFILVDEILWLILSKRFSKFSINNSRLSVAFK